MADSTIDCTVEDPISPAKANDGKPGDTPTDTGTKGTDGSSYYDSGDCKWKCSQQPTDGKIGLEGGDATSGTPGQSGQHGPIFTNTVDELSGHITITVGAQNGQAGGNGGNGGNGGPGGPAGVDPNAGTSKDGHTDSACNVASDGPQGIGGNGGNGGNGGKGGNGGQVYLYYKVKNDATWTITTNKTLGGAGGDAGTGGTGSTKGESGTPGNPGDPGAAPTASVIPIS